MIWLQTSPQTSQPNMSTWQVDMFEGLQDRYIIIVILLRKNSVMDTK